MAQEDWETSSGFDLDGADVTVTSAEFGYNANIGAGVVCLNLVMAPDSGDEEIEQSFSVGGKFEANRDGSELEGGGKVNKNSNFGTLIESIKEVLAEQEIDPDDAMGSPRVAANWVGTRWTFGTIERETMNPSTKEKKMSTKFIVTSFLGNAEGDGEAPAEKPASKPAGAAKKSGGTRVGGKPAAAKDTGSGAPEGVDDELWQQLLELANQHDDHESFLDAALELDDVAGNKAAQKAVMGTRPGSVWAAKAA